MSRDDRNDVRIRTLKALTYILRHGGPVVGLHTDADGFATLDDVMTALRVLGRIHNDLTKEQLVQAIDDPTNPRFERHGERVRVRHGHSAPDNAGVRHVFERTPPPAPAPVREMPPPVLYHWTNTRAADAILSGSGLLPRGRPYVHLSASRDEAARAGSRQGSGAALLRVDVAAAQGAGVAFTYAGERTWLAPSVPVEFIHREDIAPPRDRPAVTQPPAQRRRTVALRPPRMATPAAAPGHRSATSNQSASALTNESRPGAPRRKRGRQ